MKKEFKIGDLVRWKEHWGVIISVEAIRGTGWYTISWIKPWIHIIGKTPISQSVIHEEFLNTIEEDK